ncbi:MAG TPA: dienelactone hydrolase family protein [Actinomycetota bacterium]|nr:dienelactone hydrolase family protein [Actinomycetota bacterium]
MRVPGHVEIEINAGEVTLHGDLELSPSRLGIVVFAHGTGSSRFSPRNRLVAEALRARGLSTLLTDLLTDAEEDVDVATAHLRFDIPLLAERVVAAVDWTASEPHTTGSPIGLFGASTGAAAALVAAARRTDAVGAVVSRGGRPDLVQDLADVRAPTLLIVGGEDHQVLKLNRSAAASLRAEVRLAVIPGATHLFEEPGALDEVARLAGDWFVQHLSGVGPTLQG